MVRVNLARWLISFHIICGILIPGIHIAMIWNFAISGFMLALFLPEYMMVRLLELRKTPDILSQIQAEVFAARINPKPDFFYAEERI